MSKRKSDIIVNNVLDERGRIIYPKEFYLLMTKGFRDRYDPRRLSLALSLCGGLRGYDSIRSRFSWFRNNMSELQMTQCKPHISKKDGIIHIKTQPRYVPLPDWLANDLRNYVRYRLLAGFYIGMNLEDFRLFPKLKRSHLYDFFKRLRERHSKEFPFINDLWRIEKGYSSDGTLLWERKRYRIAPHMCRAFYCTAAWEVTNKDLKATQTLTGHQSMKNLSKYIKAYGIQEKKQEIKDRYLNTLCNNQTVPILKNQTLLSSFFNK